MSGLWPNFDSVSSRIIECVEAANNKQDFKKFQTTGTDIPIKKAPRKASPSKAGNTFQKQTSPPRQAEQAIKPASMNNAPRQEQAQQPVHREEESKGDLNLETGAAGLKEYSDLVQYPVFPGHCKGMLPKYLTREVWDKYKNATDATGCTFNQCIFSGIKNIDSGIGVYAGSPDSYTSFNGLFDKIIEDYHGHKPTDKHVSDMEASHLKAPPFEPHEAAMIKSTRIRIARNYDDVKLGPCISK